MKKKKITLNFSVLVIGIILITSSTKILFTKAQLNESQNQNDKFLFDQSTWNWTVTEFISNDQSDLAYVPSLVIDSDNNVHIVWESVDLGGTLAEHLISYKSWDALSNSWTTMEIISTETTSGAFNPRIAVDDNNNLHVVWEDDTNYDSCGSDRDIFYKKWDASTSTWTTTEVVSSESSSHSSTPSIAIDSSGRSHVVWNEDYEIFYKHWNDSASSWTSAEQISTDSSFYPKNLPDIDIDINGNIHVVWEQFVVTGIHLHYAKWNASISSWTSSINISPLIMYDALEPSIDSDSLGNVYVAWAANADGPEWNTFCRKWDKALADWLPKEIVSTETTEYLRNPSLCIDIFDNIHVAWEDSTNYDLCGTDWDIIYKYWDSSNSSWTITEVISTESTGDSLYSSLGVSKLGIVHISWQDVTHYLGSGPDEDVFYKTQIGPPTTPELAYIIPNPSEIISVFLDWNDVKFASKY
ncbi:MAG: hypothetical protein ACW96U_14180, partial [Candidatus Heimdallarchaeaceae archaeon]